MYLTVIDFIDQVCDTLSMKKIILTFSILFLLDPHKLCKAENTALKLFIPNMITAAEMKYDLPNKLLAALIQVESAGKHLAINKDDGNKALKDQGVKVTSHGLVQIQLGTAKMVQIEKAKAMGVDLNKKDIITAKQLMSPETNIEYGAMYLKWLLANHDNDISLALTCYNSGAFSRMCKNKVYYGKYVGKVLNAWAKLK